MTEMANNQRKSLLNQIREILNVKECLKLFQI